ncbi:uncharacterized protein EV422DRAFT_600068 [Fimicolochytrium jonesii]|uniref:uncharacterized protein n=1 Tax=Fimicolochytrium jonesii TaxID=1396493 RepID=UPI0022FEA5F8|nr:uncharacterized protein EV422DRAFT_600068 [Fimicolochytrium jonesii]KAI8825693.1 hypothetical protein EV422DRAFT_600068 [Fimicolochytrium jonesii]
MTKEKANRNMGSAKETLFADPLQVGHHVILVQYSSCKSAQSSSELHATAKSVLGITQLHRTQMKRRKLQHGDDVSSNPNHQNAHKFMSPERPTTVSGPQIAFAYKYSSQTADGAAPTSFATTKDLNAVLPTETKPSSVAAYTRALNSSLATMREDINSFLTVVVDAEKAAQNGSVGKDEAQPEDDEEFASEDDD